MRKESVSSFNMLADESIFEQMKEIMLKDKSHKTVEDVTYLYDVFCNLPYFIANEKKYGIDCVRSLLKCMIYHEVETDTLLMNYGENGNNCFLLIKGMVEVLTPKYSKADKLSDLIRANVMTAGVCIGERALIEKQKR